MEGGGYEDIRFERIVEGSGSMMATVEKPNSKANTKTKKPRRYSKTLAAGKMETALFLKILRIQEVRSFVIRD